MKLKYKLMDYYKVEIFQKSGWIKWILRRKYRYSFFYRLGYVLYRKNKLTKFLGIFIDEFFTKSFGPDIGLKAEVDIGLSVAHVKHAFTIRNEAIIGKNFHILQGVTIGIATAKDNKGKIVIGNNVEIGTNSIILGNIEIGDNVIIGAATFINKNIPKNTLVICKKSIIIRRNNEESNKNFTYI